MTIKFRAELKQKRAELKCSALILTFRPPVGLPGYEPGMSGPESVVLPLHHRPMPLSFLTMQK